MTVAHVEVLATAVKRREELYPEHEQTLLDAARSVNPEDLVTAARRWRELADDELASLDAASAYAKRYLHVSPTIGGARIDGFLDPVGAATVISALDALLTAGSRRPTPRRDRIPCATPTRSCSWRKQTLGDPSAPAARARRRRS